MSIYIYIYILINCVLFTSGKQYNIIISYSLHTCFPIMIDGL